MEKDQDDANSVMYWVAEMEREEHNPVLCFKSQGESSDQAGIEKNNFFLGIQRHVCKICPKTSLSV